MKFIVVEVSDSYENEVFTGRKMMVNLSLANYIVPLESGNTKLFFGTKWEDGLIINYKYDDLKELLFDL